MTGMVKNKRHLGNSKHASEHLTIHGWSETFCLSLRLSQAIVEHDFGSWIDSSWPWYSGLCGYELGRLAECDVEDFRDSRRVFVSIGEVSIHSHSSILPNRELKSCRKAGADQRAIPVEFSMCQ